MNGDIKFILSLLQQCLLNQSAIMKFLDEDYFEFNIKAVIDMYTLVEEAKKENEMPD